MKGFHRGIPLTMTWSNDQLVFYQKLLLTVADKHSWIAIAAACFPEFSPTAPASEEAIARGEQKLGRKLPEDLRSLYLECDGIAAAYRRPVLSLEEMVVRNEDLRRNPSYLGLYMPFENLLFFGEEGNGDLYGYPIRNDGSYPHDVFQWDHESDSRSWRANSLRDLLARVATDFCG